MFINLLQNLSVFLGLVLVFFTCIALQERSGATLGKLGFKLLMGGAFSLIGIAVIGTNVPITEGVIIDARTVLLTVTGLFFGLLPGSMVAGTLIGYRAMEGGVGFPPAVAVIAVSVGLGLLLRYAKRGRLEDLRPAEIVALSFASHIFSAIVLVVFLGEPLGRDLIGLVALFLTVYPLATILLCFLLRHHLRVEADRSSLRKEQRRNRSLARAVEQAPVSIVVTDQDGVIEYVNPFFTEISGYTEKEAIGQRTSILSAGVQTQRFYETLWTTIKNGDVWEGEFCNRSKDGSIFWETASISPVRDRKGEITRYVAVKQDITERKKRTWELERARRSAEAAAGAKTAFFSKISHELRTPLNQIIAPCGLLLEELQSEAQRELAQMAYNASEELLGHIERILALTAAEGRQSEVVVVEPFDYWLEVRTEHHVGAAQAKGYTVVVALSPDFPRRIVVDAEALDFILNAYLENALIHALPGEIRVAINPLGCRAILSVIDSGPGLDGGNGEPLFEPIANAKPGSMTELPEGLGLSLATCRRFATAAGGRVFAEPSGAGTAFCYEFPIGGDGAEQGGDPPDVSDSSRASV